MKKRKLTMVYFLAVLCDGSTDKSVTEPEVVYTFIFKLYGPFLWMGFNCLKTRATSRTQFTFYH